MKIRVTVDCFSGRENPTVELEGSEAKQLVDLVQAGRALDAEQTKPVRHRLGYRGVIIEHLDGKGDRLPRRC